MTIIIKKHRTVFSFTKNWYTSRSDIGFDVVNDGRFLGHMVLHEINDQSI